MVDISHWLYPFGGGRWRRFSRCLVPGTALLLIAFHSWTGCGGGDKTTGTPPPSLENAWGHFEDGDYAGALSLFLDLLQTNPSLADAQNGVGWSNAYLGELAAAESAFADALELEAGMTAAHAGRSAVRLAAGDHAGAIEDASAAIAADPDWSFEHRAGVDVQDLHLILAQAWFGSGEEQFPQAQAQVDLLDPDNGLSPQDPSSWGEAPTYAAALLLHLQELEERIGAELAI